MCNPDYYFNSAHWSPPTGASHNTNYQMWDACMDSGTVSRGVALVSQFGSTSTIVQEYAAAGDNILDTFIASGILGSGTTSRDLDVDKAHQWVSTVTMLAPSQDRMVGVANLRLCEGHDWKRSVKVCSELFSTATRSARVHEAMQRNTVQWNNCSFGYFEFTFKEYQNATQEPPVDCEHDRKYSQVTMANAMGNTLATYTSGSLSLFLESFLFSFYTADRVCPPSEHHPRNCRTCCCKSSDNVEFHHPGNGANESVCGATENAAYKISLVPSFSDVCHPDYPFVGGIKSSYFSGLLIMSHDPYRFYDKCLKKAVPEVFNFISKTEDKLQLFREFLVLEREKGHVFTYHLSKNVLERVENKNERRTGWVRVNPIDSHVSFLSKLVST